MTVALRTAGGIVSSREQAADIAQDVALDVLRLAAPAARARRRSTRGCARIAVRHALRALKQQSAPHPADVPLGLD